MVTDLRHVALAVPNIEKGVGFIPTSALSPKPGGTARQCAATGGTRIRWCWSKDRAAASSTFAWAHRRIASRPCRPVSKR